MKVEEPTLKVKVSHIHRILKIKHVIFDGFSFYAHIELKMKEISSDAEL